MSIANIKISVVMACYYGDKLGALVEAIDSMLNQTLAIYEFIIVVDGPVSGNMERYLDQVNSDNHHVNLIKLSENSGAANARNIGMNASSGDYIAIMDSDDISYANRLETQYNALREYDADVVWAWQTEFYDESKQYVGLKRCPEFHDEIVRSLKWRCLLPDPTTFMKRECLQKTGGYGSYRDLNIDYHFFLEMKLSGCKFYAVQEPLIKVRVSPVQRKRRGGLKLLKQDYEFRKWMISKNLLNHFEFILVMFMYVGFRLQPNWMRDWVYRFFLRR